jgi:hypothetical protein
MRELGGKMRDGSGKQEMDVRFPQKITRRGMAETGVRVKVAEMHNMARHATRKTSAVA